MSLPALNMRSNEDGKTTFDRLPIAVVHWKFVQLLFEERQMERACKTLVQFAATHHGATQDAQYIADGACMGPIEPEERRIRYREWYWRRAYELFFITSFREILAGRELPVSPLIGASWETDFKELCKELNGQAANPTIRRLQRVNWTQRELDRWWQLSTTGTRQYTNIAAVLEFVGARTTPDAMGNYWAPKDRLLTRLVEILNLTDSWLGAAEFQEITTRIHTLREEGAQMLAE